MRPPRLKIDVTKILKDSLFVGKKGTYLDAVFFEKKDGPDDDGFTHFIVQDLGKEARLAGTRGPIIGNAALPVAEDDAPSERRMPPPAPASTSRVTAPPDDPADDIPF